MHLWQLGRWRSHWPNVNIQAEKDGASAAYRNLASPTRVAAFRSWNAYHGETPEQWPVQTHSGRQEPCLSSGSLRAPFAKTPGTGPSADSGSSWGGASHRYLKSSIYVRSHGNKARPYVRFMISDLAALVAWAPKAVNRAAMAVRDDQARSGRPKRRRSAR
jgi:hypothetical protein